MSRLRSVADFEREIAELNRMIKEQEEALGQDSGFALQLSNEALRGRIAELSAEMAAIGDEGMRGHEIDLIFKGQPVHGTRVTAEFMGKVLLGVQTLVRSMLSSEGPDDTRVGPFKASIKKASELQFAGSFPGSFGMRLEVGEEQLQIDGAVSLAPTLQLFLELMEAGDNEEAMLSRVAELSKRATSDYEDLMKVLSGQGADMKVVWPNLSGRREASLKAGQANRILATLKEIEEDSNGRWYRGTLDISNRRYGRFGFTTIDGEVFDGAVEDEVVPQLRDYYDRLSDAWIETKEITHRRTGVVKRSHRLQELRNPEAADSN